MVNSDVDDLLSSIPSFDKKHNYDFNEIGNAATMLSDMFLGTNFYGNSVNQQIAGQNLEWQKEYAEKQEGLIREAWSREDNAVQRRVEDLKAAGLSPTLAAGSAAATSQPIQLKAPQNEYRYENPFGGGVIHALGTVLALKNADLQNQMLQKQVDTYGEPAWFKALTAILDKVGDKGFMNTFIENSVNGVENALDAVGVEHGKVEFTPKFGFTFAKPTSGVSSSVPAVVESLKGFDAQVSKNSEGTYDISFSSAAEERKWYISIGGTPAEWYYGIATYGSPEAFLEHILKTGGNYFE